MPPEKNNAGKHTVIFALKTILYNKDKEENEVIISPRKFGKIMKGLSVHDKRETLTRSELIKYQNQLVNALRMWPSEGDDEWKAREGDGSKFYIVFERRGQ